MSIQKSNTKYESVTLISESEIFLEMLRIKKRDVSSFIKGGCVPLGREG